MKPGELSRTVARIGELVAEIEETPDAGTRERARELVQALLDLHRAGLQRLLELARAPADELAGDEAISLLLALHELHRSPVEARVRAAIDALAPRLRGDGVAVEIRAISDERVHVSLTAAGPVTAHVAGLRAQLEAVVRRSAPEVAAVDIDGLEASDIPASRLMVGPPKR